MCTQYERSGKDVPPHDCQKNWDGPSSSMETDILLEGFKQAELHGLRYTKFIGDGDSSVFPTLVTQVPVWGHAIEKNRVCKPCCEMLSVCIGKFSEG